MNWRLAFLASRRAQLLEEKKRLYREIVDPAQIVQYQLALFNRVWLAAQVKTSFYRDWALRHRLPRQIESIADLRQFPALSKHVIREHQDQIARDVSETKGLFYVSTGGSTGEPIRYPTSRAEKEIEYANTYLGKSWWGIEPFDRILQLWGHSHLFGTGWLGKLKEGKRRLYDLIICTRRLNAYNMSGDRIRRYAQEIAAWHPQAVIGYTSALFKVAQFAKGNSISLDNQRLKGVIVTAETATGHDIAMIHEVFRKPVVIEYGMAETGVISYSRNATEDCTVLWDSFLCTEADDGVRLSTLYDRCFPLVNYSTGDMFSNSVSSQGSILGFSNLRGRLQENLTLFALDQCNLYVVSGILIVHILKGCPGISSVASSQVSDGIIRIFVTSPEQADTAELMRYLIMELEQELGPIDRDSLSMVQVDATRLSLAGKHLPVIATAEEPSKCSG